MGEFMGECVVGVLSVSTYVEHFTIDGILQRRPVVLYRVKCTESQARGYFADYKKMNPYIRKSLIAVWTARVVL